MGRLLVEFLFAEDAISWADSPANLEAWKKLYADCPWRFPTLGPDFFRLWSRHYGKDWIPLLAIGMDHGGGLGAIFPLAVGNELITGAGAHQAEYQGWLSSEKDASAFLTDAIQAIKERFPSQRIRLRYLAPGIPDYALVPAFEHHPRAILSRHSRPLLRLDKESLEKNLRKKSTRSKLNRLKRKGNLTFRKLTEIEDIRKNLDSMIAMYDFRQGATNDSCPFHDDPDKRAFLLDWAAQSADKELHISCLTLNEQVVAAHIGVNGDVATQLAILAYSPEHGACSPGKLQVYQTARMLAEEGKVYLDLTPGGDPWKERFATEHDTLLALDVYPSNIRAMRTRFNAWMDKSIRSALSRAGVSPTRLKASLLSAPRLLPGEILRALRPAHTEYRLYRAPLQKLALSSPAENVRINDLRQLILYDPAQEEPGRQHFLSRALARLESGDSIYSMTDGARLLCSARLSAPLTETFIREIEQTIRFPAPSHVIDDLYFHPDILKSGDATILVRRILSDLKEDGAEAAYLGVSTANMNDDSLKALGFEAVGSAYLSRRLWHKRRTQDIRLDDDA